jgi:DNA-binding GntR family transcriptional regulator
MAIADQLRERIQRGALAPGDQLPTETELMEWYAVSRPTARAAIRELIQTGVAETDHPRGTFVRKYERMDYLPQLESRPHRTDAGHDRFTEQIKAEGREPSMTISVEIIPAPPHVAERLELKADQAIVVRRRVRSINGQPVNTNDSFFLLEIVKDTEIMNPADIPRGTNQVLTDLGYKQVDFDDVFDVRMPTPEESYRLDLPPGTPVVIHTATGYTESGRPVRCAVNVLNGPRHRIRYKRRWEGE